MVLILGAGESGIGAALLAKQKGISLFVSDQNKIKSNYKQELIDHDIDFEECSHEIARTLSPDIIIKSPGIPDNIELLRHLVRDETELISEIEFAYRYCKGRIIGITGSNGKTTTTNLCHHIIASTYPKTVKAGNVGYSFARAVAENKYENFVLELSSFQLDGIVHFKPNTGIILNVTPDHLDRYENNFQLYLHSKFKIAMNQTESETLIVYGKDPAISSYLNSNSISSRLISIQPEIDSTGRLHINDRLVLDRTDIPLKGIHNYINTACALLAAELENISMDKAIEALKTFKNDPHRLEWIATINGIEFINDSKATNVDSVYWALKAMEKPIVWIAGGQDKGNDYSSVMEAVKQKVKALVCMGVKNEKLLQTFSEIVPVCVDTHNISDAVEHAFKLASEGDVVLLSPACASFDLFMNYEDRGNQFRAKITELKINQY